MKVIYMMKKYLIVQNAKMENFILSIQIEKMGMHGFVVYLLIVMVKQNIAISVFRYQQLMVRIVIMKGVG